jgi:hypothetical protein
MTRSEAEALVRKHKRVCKGSLLVDQATQLTFMQRINTCDPSLLPQLVEDVVALRKRVGFADSKLLPNVSSEKLLGWCLESIRAHKSDIGEGCGRDFNDEVCAQPFDGAARDYTCPNCGATGTYRSPIYDSG